MKINTIPKDNVSPDLLDYLKLLGCDVFRKQQLKHIDKRNRKLKQSHDGLLPQYPNTKSGDWKAELPEWMSDQRNQMTGPADNDKLVVKLLNSDSPGVMLDLEDSMANDWPELKYGIMNCIDALHGELTYTDSKTGLEVGIDTGKKTVCFIRVRGLHMTQRIEGFGDIPAPLFDLAALTHGIDIKRLKHPLCIYIPKTEYSTEAYWWGDVFTSIERLNSWEPGYIKAMALVESHPMAYEMEEFAFHMQPHLIGLNLGRWDYMASLIDYNFNNPDFLFPDRNSVPTDTPFFQNLRHRMAYVCHKHGMLAIGGMTALYPSRTDAELNKRALAILDIDKRNEAACLMDGAWTGHPDQNSIAVNAFPSPNQLDKLPSSDFYRPNLREFPKDKLEITREGTKEAIKTAVKYRYGVIEGKGAVLINGYMEDLATDRIYRIIVSQRLHKDIYSWKELDAIFQEVVDELGREYGRAAVQTRDMIFNKEFNPV